MQKFIVAIICLVFISCGQKNESVKVPVDFNPENLIDIMKNPENLSQEKLAEIAGTESGKIKISKDYFSPDPSKRTLLFSWPNGGQKTIQTMKGKELKMDAYSSLGIGFIRKISREDFQKQFESKEFIQNEINRITSDEGIPTDVAISEAKNWAQNAKIQQFERMEEIDELAFWETPVHALHFYNNGFAFTISTNLENSNESKSKAIELLNLILKSKS